MNHCMIATNNFDEEPGEVEVEDTGSVLYKGGSDPKEPLEDFPKVVEIEV